MRESLTSQFPRYIYGHGVAGSVALLGTRYLGIYCVYVDHYDKPNM